MTVATNTITSGPYTGNGVTSSFSYTFRVGDKTQLKVFETDTDGVVTELTVDTDYTVNDVGTDGGGTIDRIAGALPSGYTWYIRSNYDVLQNTDYDSQGAYFPGIHEASFDKLHFLIQQLYDLVGRSFRLSDSDPDAETVNLELPDVAARASRVLVFDANGDLDVGALIGSWRGDWATATSYTERDLFIDPATNNVYFVLDDHTSTSIAADVSAGDIELVIDAEYVKTQADAAAASASAAAASAAAASTSETNAGNSKTAAEAAQTAAETAQAAAEAIYDNFDDRYLGAKASAPTLDNDGDPLTNGDLYFDTTLNVLRVYDADDTTWISLPATTLVSLTDVVLASITAGELLMWNGTNWINRTADEALLLAITATTGAAKMPTGNIAQRPGTPQAGYLRYNSETSSFEGYISGSWTGIGGASGGAGNPFVYENDTNVTADYTITSGKNAMSAGPITIDSGFTVTVPSGSVWTIV